MSVRVSKPDGTDVVAKSPVAPFITSAHWSPDGAWIAYDAPGAANLHDLFLVDPDSDTTRDLTADFAPGVCCARWSPDSKALLVAGTEGDDKESALLAVARRRVADPPGHDHPGLLHRVLLGPRHAVARLIAGRHPAHSRTVARHGVALRCAAMATRRSSRSSWPDAVHA